jgi:hypothetical protein
MVFNAAWPRRLLLPQGDVPAFKYAEKSRWAPWDPRDATQNKELSPSGRLATPGRRPVYWERIRDSVIIILPAS